MVRWDTVAPTMIVIRAGVRGTVPTVAVSLNSQCFTWCSLSLTCFFVRFVLTFRSSKFFIFVSVSVVLPRVVVPVFSFKSSSPALRALMTTTDVAVSTQILTFFFVVVFAVAKSAFATPVIRSEHIPFFCSSCSLVVRVCYSLG